MNDAPTTPTAATPPFWLGRLGELPRAWFALLAAGVMALGRLPLLLTDLLNLDEGVWWMAARLWLGGGTPYVDFIDNKPPVIFAIYALPQLLGIETLYAVHLLTLLWVGATASVVGLLVGQLSGEEGPKRTALSRWAVLLYLTLSAAGSARQFLFLNTETAGLLFLILAMLCYSRSRLSGDGARGLVLAGMFVALAGLTRQTLLICLPLLGLELLWPPAGAGGNTAGARGWLRRNLLFGAGFLVPLAAALVLLHRAGVLEEAGYWIYTVNRHHMELDPGLSYKLTRFATNILPALLVGLPVWAMALLGVGTPGRWREPRARLRALWTALALANFWAASLAGRWLGHYYLPVLAPLVAAAAAALSQENGGRRTRLAHRLAGPALALALLGAAGFSAAGGYRVLAGKTEETSPIMRAAATRVRALTKPGDSIYVWGFGQTLYYRSRRSSASRFIIPYTSVSGYLFGAQRAFPDLDPWELIIPEHWDRLLDDLRASRPRLVLDFAEGDVHLFGKHRLERYPQLRHWILENYERLPDEGPIVFYRRRAP